MKNVLNQETLKRSIFVLVYWKLRRLPILTCIGLLMFNHLQLLLEDSLLVSIGMLLKTKKTGGSLSLFRGRENMKNSQQYLNV